MLFIVDLDMLKTEKKSTQNQKGHWYILKVVHHLVQIYIIGIIHYW